MGTRRPFEDKFEYLLSPVKPGPSATTELLSPKPTSPSIPHNYLMTMSSQSSERTGVTNDALPEEMELLTPDNETQEEMVEGLLDGDGELCEKYSPLNLLTLRQNLHRQ